MAMGSGLLALAVAMVGLEGPTCPPVETTTYQVRVLTLDGLDWRTSSYHRLQPVARQGMSMIWTADRTLATALADRARESSPCHTVMAVGETELTKAEVIYYNAALDRVADGPVNQSSTIAFMPRPEQVEERFSIRVEGRKLDQGTLTRIALEETHVDVIHNVSQTETLIPPATKAQMKGTMELGREILNVMLSPNPTIPAAKSITSSVQIPEVSRASVAGEWLIPNDGVLIVSLGVKTAADDKGMAVARERIAVIEACPGSMAPDARKPTLGITRLDSRPAVPSRSLPQPVDPSGNLVDLPPLPEGLASADLDRIKPEPNQPSPQAPGVSSPSADPALARTGYDAAPPPPKNPAKDKAKDDDEDGGTILLSEIIDGLTKAGVKLVVDVEPKVMPKPECEKCDGDATFCPAIAKAMKGGKVAGGMEFVAGGKSQMGVTIRDASGMQIFDSVADLDEAIKVPGKTETIQVPLGGPLSLELKATVVPTAPEPSKTATKKVETPAARR